MKKFGDFINEAKLRGTKGVPSSYISDVERRARQETGGVDPRQAFGRGMSLMQRSKELLVGDLVPERQKREFLNRFFSGRLTQEDKTLIERRFKQIEDLAELVIRANYESILDNVDLDIKLVNSGMDVQNFIEENSTRKIKAKPEIEKEREEQIKSKAKLLPKSTGSELTPEEIEKVKSGIDRQKIANVITQGEAKNTKKLLHSEEVKEGLKNIFPEEIAKEIFNVWDELTKLADKMDWMIPVEQKARMMEDMPQGMAGACAAEWPDAPEATGEQQDSIEDSISEGEDPIEENKEIIEDLLSQGNPKIKAVGIDFPMLLHETIKGLYQMIMAVIIPQDPKIAQLIKLGTSSFEDEAEDFQYGPYIAADIRDFIFRNPKSTDYPNIREFVNGEIMQLPDDEFFPLIEKILLSKVEGKDNPEARKKVDEIVDSVIKKLKDYELSQSIDVEGESEFDNEIDKLLGAKPDQEGERLMTKSELIEAIDDALDSGDKKLVDKLAKELKTRFPD